MATVRRRSKAKASTPQNRYDAGGTGRRTAHWNPPTSGPQKALQGFEKMRSRVHDAVRNDWAAKSSTQKWTTALIGTGIQPRFKNPKHRKLWDRFCKTADADSVLDAYGLQVLGSRALFDGGEVFERRRPRALTAPLDIPVQIQLIEGEYCPMLDADTWPGLPEGNKIRQGVELTRYGQRAAYWFYKEHPGDGSVSPSPDQLVRVAASQVSHIYELERPGQLRGVSPLSAILVRLRSTADWEDATLDRQKLANLFTLFITRALPEDVDLEYDPLTGLPVVYGKDGGPVAGLEPGLAQRLLPGEDVKFANPPGVGVGHGEYLRSNNLGTAAGQGLPYEMMSGDIKDVSDRTLRVVINEFRRYCQQRQWITLVPRLCQPMLDWCMDAAALAGLLPLSQLEEAKAPTWTPQGWEYIHPVQDAQGKKILLDMGVISKTSIITERGDEPEKVFEERKKDSEEEDRLGIKQAADGTLLEDAPEPVEPPDAGSEPGEPENVQFWARVMESQARASAPPANDALEKTLAALVTLVSGMQAQNAAMASAVTAVAQALAERDVNITTPPVTNNITTPPAAVQIDNHITTPEPVVNVQPAAVQIDNHITTPEPIVNVTNNVQPAAVEVDVNLPDREITSVIERDSRTGDITNVTQTERTLQ